MEIKYSKFNVNYFQMRIRRNSVGKWDQIYSSKNFDFFIDKARINVLTQSFVSNMGCTSSICTQKDRKPLDIIIIHRKHEVQSSEKITQEEEEDASPGVISVVAIPVQHTYPIANPIPTMKASIISQTAVMKRMELPQKTQMLLVKLSNNAPPLKFKVLNSTKKMQVYRRFNR